MNNLFLNNPMCLSILFVLAISLILKNIMEVFCVYLVNNDCQHCLQISVLWVWCLPRLVQFFLKPLEKLWLISSVVTVSGSALPTLPQTIFLYQIYGWRQILKWCTTLKMPWYGRLKWHVMNFNRYVTAKWCSRTEIFKNAIINRFSALSCLGQTAFHVVISQMWQYKCLQTLSTGPESVLL